MKNINTPVILFDGVCNLCNRLIMFIIKLDPNAKFKFASLQSVRGQSLLIRFGLPTDDFNSVVFILGDDYFLKSTAILHILKELGGIWKLFYVFIFVPKAIRDFIYNRLAKTRYSIFGKQNNCAIPNSEIKQRFLD